MSRLRLRQPEDHHTFKQQQEQEQQYEADELEQEEERLANRSRRHGHRRHPTATTSNAPPTPPARDPIHVTSSLLAGMGSGALASLLCAPLDLLRTRLQVWGDLSRKQQMDILQKASPPLTTAPVTTTATNQGTNHHGTSAATARSQTTTMGMVMITSSTNAPPTTTASASNTPRVGQLQTILRLVRDIQAKEGLKGFFRGLGATLVTVPMFWGVYFPLYDESKRSWKQSYPDTNPALIHMGSAVFAGAVSDILCNPMFVVRTRLQTEALHDRVDHVSRHRPYSMTQTAQALYREGGIRIFWRGMTANLMGLSHVAVQFPVYEQLKHTLKRNKEHESALDLLVASGLSKMTASLISYPHEVIRSRMMDARSHRVSLVAVCRRIYSSEGMIGFYAGLPVTLIRVIPNTCVTFITYELVLRWARRQIHEPRLQL